MSDAAPQQPKKTKGGLIWILLVVVAAIAPPTGILLVVGLLPSIIAFLTDEYPQKYSALTVSSFNLCGILPFLIQLWSNGHNLEGVAIILQNLHAWLIMYGAASLGWFCYYMSPVFASMYIAVRDERLMDKIKREQARLEKEWGPEVKATTHKK